MSEIQFTSAGQRDCQSKGVLLLLERDPGSRAEEREFLENAGFEVLQADTVAQVETLSRDQPIDGILIDADFLLHHPRFLQQNSFEELAAPVQILATEFKDERLAAEAFLAGIQHFVSNAPVYLELLPKAIANIIESRKLRRKTQAIKEQFFQMVESMPDVVLIIDRAGKIQYVNKQAADVWHRPPDGMIGEDFGIPVIAGESTQVDFYDSQLEKIRFFELRTVQIEIDGSPVLMVSMRDQTDRIKIEENLKIALNDADAAGRLKTQFLANISHEVRTPISAILGYLDLLTENAQDPQAAMDAIRMSARQVLDLFSRLLEFSELGSGSVKLESMACSPWQLLQGVVATNLRAAEVKDVTLRLVAAGQVPKQIITAPESLIQILNIILSNAIKFSQEGQEVLTSMSVDEQFSNLCIAVCDKGIGMSEDRIATLFQPFGQADGSYTRQYSGSGMNLSVAKRLASLLKGDIEVQSTPNEGSTFRVILPLSASHHYDLVKGEGLDSSVRRESSFSDPRSKSQLRNLFEFSGTTDQTSLATRPKYPDPKTLASPNQCHYEESRLHEALDQNQGNLTKAAKALGLSVSQFYRYLKRYGIEPKLPDHEST